MAERTTSELIALLRDDDSEYGGNARAVLYEIDRQEQEKKAQEGAKKKSPQFELGHPDPLLRSRLPMEALPITVRWFAEEVGRSLLCEPEMPALFALGMLSGALGYTRRLRITDDWSCSGCLWIAVVAPPGAKKTPAFNMASAPLIADERQRFEEYDTKEARWKEEIRVWEQADPERRGPRPEPFAWDLHRRVVGNVTAERLATLLARNPRGLILLRDELSSWWRSFGQYKGGKGNDRSGYLAWWSHSFDVVDRQTDQTLPRTVWAPSLAIVGGMQPAILPELCEKEGDEDGLMDRFLFGFPEMLAEVETFDRSRSVSGGTLDAYRELFDQLFRFELLTDPETGKVEPEMLEFSPEALDVWTQCFNAHATDARSPLFDSALSGAWSKMPEHAGRLCCLIHCCRYAEGSADGMEVDTRDVLSAWALVDYFKYGATRARDLLSRTGIDGQIERVNYWLDMRGKVQITLREAMRGKIVHGKEEGARLFRIMEDRGLGRVLEQHLKNGQIRLTYCRFGPSTDEVVFQRIEPE